MANIKSAKKRARQTIKRNAVNQKRRSSLKTAVRRVLDALGRGDETPKVAELLKSAQAQFARAKGKGLLHANTAARKMSRLSKKVQQASK